MKQADEVKHVIDKYGNSVYRLCYYMLQNDQDAQDVLQETLIRFLEKAPDFSSSEHEKAWLLRVANNICIDSLRFRRKERFLDENDLEWLENQFTDYGGISNSREVIQFVFSLKEKYRNVIYLYYYEEYQIKEIAAIMKISEAAVRKRLERGREFLKKCLQEEYYEK